MVRLQFAVAMLMIRSSLGDKTIPEKRLRGRRLSFEEIAGFIPFTQVTDHVSIDLDQAALEGQLSVATDDAYLNAKAIYEEGAHTKSYAEVTLDSPLSAALAKGTAVKGEAEDGSRVEGKLMSDASEGSMTVKILYATSDILPNVRCTVGALSRFDGENTEGCFAGEGELSIEGTEFDYKYDVSSANKNGRSLAGFSTAAEAKMFSCSKGCPHEEYVKYYEYYGTHDYANQIVLAAFNQVKTSFKNGNADFTKSTFSYRSQAIKKGIPYMNVYMYVIREMEDALAKCVPDAFDELNEPALHSWDEGVAFYAGTLEGTDGSGSGKLLHAVAEKRCQNFKTCGEKGNSITGGAYVNYKIIELFNLGKQELYLGDCEEKKGGEVRKVVNKIISQMAVPMIQGTLRYAYKVGVLKGPDKDKELAEGGAFSHAILPRLADVSSKDAKTLYENIGYGAQNTDFAAVKKALEKNYKKMGITCDDVGGLWDTASNDYYPGASPC